MMDKTNKRNISREDNFMKERNANDVIFSYILNKATKDTSLWIPKTLCSGAAIKRGLAECSKASIHEHTIRKTVKYLTTIGILKEATKKINNTNRKVYIIKQYDFSKYAAVDTSIIELMTSIGSTNLLKTYCYLKSKYDAYLQNPNKYSNARIITYQRIAEALGLYIDGHSRKVAKDLLSTLLDLHLVEVQAGEINNDGAGRPTQILYITSVAEKYTYNHMLSSTKK